MSNLFELNAAAAQLGLTVESLPFRGGHVVVLRAKRLHAGKEVYIHETHHYQRNVSNTNRDKAEEEGARVCLLRLTDIRTRLDAEEKTEAFGDNLPSIASERKLDVSGSYDFFWSLQCNEQGSVAQETEALDEKAILEAVVRQYSAPLAGPVAS
ncbi:hypothetical protein [Paraburkholderia caffeinilytica]|uniref:hypothetical protein n=1 Tax=Paraburkholderia caffeinilytica TaxID=1761016 RepID=UPI003DA1A1E0